MLVLKVMVGTKKLAGRVAVMAGEPLTPASWKTISQPSATAMHWLNSRKSTRLNSTPAGAASDENLFTRIEAHAYL